MEEYDRIVQLIPATDWVEATYHDEAQGLTVWPLVAWAPPGARSAGCRDSPTRRRAGGRLSLAFVAEPEQFVCMFCGQSIEGDPLQVTLTRPSDADISGAHPTSAFWSHLACLRARMHPSTSGYLLVWEPDSN